MATATIPGTISGPGMNLSVTRVCQVLGSPGGLEQTRLNNLTSWVYVKTLDRRYALESRCQRTIEPVRTVNQLVAIRRSSWALDDFHWRGNRRKPETPQKPPHPVPGLNP